MSDFVGGAPRATRLTAAAQAGPHSSLTARVAMPTTLRLLGVGLLLTASAPTFGQRAAYVGDLQTVDRAVLNAAALDPNFAPQAAPQRPREAPKRTSFFGKLTPSWLMGSNDDKTETTQAPAASGVQPVAYNRRSSLSHRPGAKPRTRWTQPAPTKPTTQAPQRSGGVATRATTGQRASLVDLVGFSKKPQATNAGKLPAPIARPTAPPAPSGVRVAHTNASALPLPIALAPNPTAGVGAAFVGDGPQPTTPQMVADPALAALAKAPSPEAKPLIVINDAAISNETIVADTPIDEAPGAVLFVTDASDGFAETTDSPTLTVETTESVDAAPEAIAIAAPPTIVTTPAEPITIDPESGLEAATAAPIVVSDAPVAETPSTTSLDQPELDPLPTAASIAARVTESAAPTGDYQEQRIGLPPRRPSREPEPSDRAKSLLAEAHGLAQEAAEAEDYTAILQRCRYVLAIDRAPQAVAYANQLAAWSLNCRGEALLEQGRVDEAEADFTDALRTDQECWRAEHNLGVLHSHRGETERARQRFDRTLRLNPEYAKAYSNRAALAVRDGDFQTAMRDYERAIEADPDLAIAHAGRGRICHLLGKLEMALRHLDAAALLEPGDASIAVARGDLLVDLGRYGNAKAAYERAIAIDPEDATAYRNLAWMQATCPLPAFRDGQAAVINAKRAAELTGDQDDITLDTQAAAEAAVGRFEEAVALAQRAIDAAPEADAEAYLKRLDGYLRGEAFTSRPIGSGVVQASYTK